MLIATSPDAFLILPLQRLYVDYLLLQVLIEPQKDMSTASGKSLRPLGAAKGKLPKVPGLVFSQNKDSDTDSISQESLKKFLEKKVFLKSEKLMIRGLAATSEPDVVEKHKFTPRSLFSRVPIRRRRASTLDSFKALENDMRQSLTRLTMSSLSADEHSKKLKMQVSVLEQFGALAQQLRVTNSSWSKAKTRWKKAFRKISSRSRAQKIRAWLVENYGGDKWNDVPPLAVKGDET